jgi:hypothetical protein
MISSKTFLPSYAAAGCLGFAFETAANLKGANNSVNCSNKLASVINVIQ